MKRAAWPGDTADMKVSAAAVSLTAALRFWMSRSTAAKSFHATGPLHAGPLGRPPLSPGKAAA